MYRCRVKNNLKQFDQVCKGFYGTPEKCLKDMKERLFPSSNFNRAIPLYFFNMRSEVGMTDEVRAMIKPFLKDKERPSCRKAAEIVLKLNS